MAYGDLGAVVDTLKYRDFGSKCNENAHVVGDIFCVSLRGYLADGIVITFSIDALGEISDSIIDTIIHRTGTSDDRTCLAKLTDSLYAIANCDAQYKIMIDTIQIYADGQIKDTKLDGHRFPTTSCLQRKLQKCGPGMLALSWRNYDADEGHLWTIRIYGDGSIDETLVDTLQFESTKCREPFLENIHPGIWAVAYTGPGIGGTLKTFSITESGIIADTALDTLFFEAGEMQFPSIVKARDDFVAISYTTSSLDGKLAIVEISDTGAITDSVIDTYHFETTHANRMEVYSIGQGYIGVVYHNNLLKGILKTFLVDEDGKLNDTTIDTLMYDAVASNFQHVIHVTGDVWAVTHGAASATADVNTFGLETPPEPGGRKDLMMGIYR